MVIPVDGPSTISISKSEACLTEVDSQTREAPTPAMGDPLNRQMSQAL